MSARTCSKYGCTWGRPEAYQLTAAAASGFADRLADRFVKDPADVVKVQQKVTVMSVDLERQRIGLSMKSTPDLTGQRPQRPGPAEKSAATSAPRPKRPEAAPAARPDSNNPFVEFFKNRKP